MRITVLDSDTDQAAAICDALAACGHDCVRQASGRAVVDDMRRMPADLLIANWQATDIPPADLIALTREAAGARTPILAVISRSAEEDAAAALSTGIDDYIVAPVRRHELILRVQALLRVVHPASMQETLQFGRYRFDMQSGRAWCDATEIVLTRKELAVALLFLRNLGRPLSRAFIQESVWPQEEGLPSRTIDTHVSRVRTKLGLIPENGYRLAPVYSFGYRLEELA